MRIQHTLLPAFAALFLTQCVGPYPGGPMGPAGGPPPPVPGYGGPVYTPQQEQYRNEWRDMGRQQNQMAYERGVSDGRADYGAGLDASYQRHYQSYTPATQSTYTQGYDFGYAPAGGRDSTEYRPAPAPDAAPDPYYNRGYDFGLRDRVGGRPQDPGAHSGAYDPRYRRSFERGYLDGYERRR